MLVEDHSLLFLGLLLILVFLTLASSSCSKCLDGSCDSNGLCTNGCVVGYADKKCQHRCQSTCKSIKCNIEMTTGKTVCSEGCEDGYCGVQCKTPCPDGCFKCGQHTCQNCTLCRSSLYGEACQHSCFDKCLGFACDNTGRCQNKCMDGYYGVNCTKTCNPRYGICQMLTGTCIKCRLGFYGDSCEHLCPSCLHAREDSYTCQSGCVLCSVSGKDTVTQVSPNSKLNRKPVDMYFIYLVGITVCQLLLLLWQCFFTLVRRRHSNHHLSICSQQNQMNRHRSRDNEAEMMVDIA